MDRGAWWAAVHGVAQSRTRLGQLSMHACIGEGNGSPLQCSCLENPRDGGAWWAAISGVAQSQTWLKWLSSSILRNALEKILSLDSVTVTSSDSLHPLIQDAAEVPSWDQWFSSCGLETLGCPLTGHLKSQNYFHNNTETFFALSTVSWVYSTIWEAPWPAVMSSPWWLLVRLHVFSCSKNVSILIFSRIKCVSHSVVSTSLWPHAL